MRGAAKLGTLVSRSLHSYIRAPHVSTVHGQAENHHQAHRILYLEKPLLQIPDTEDGGLAQHHTAR